MIHSYKKYHVSDFADFYDPITFDEFTFLSNRISNCADNKHI